MITFTVPGVPVGKGRARHTTRGGFARAYTPKKTKDYEDSVKAAFAASGHKKIEGPLEMRLTAFMPIPKSFSKKKREQALRGDIMPTTKPDASNIAKCIEDGLNGLAYHDDSSIVDLRIVKLYSDAPSVRVMIRPFEAAPF